MADPYRPATPTESYAIPASAAPEPSFSLDTSTTQSTGPNPYYFGDSTTGDPVTVVWEDGKRQTYQQPSAFTEDTALGLLNNLRTGDKGSVDKLKQDLYWAGYYSGTDSPLIGNDEFDDNDLKALYDAVHVAGLNGYTDPTEFIAGRAQMGRANLTPLGTTLKQKDNPVYQLQQLATLNGVKLSKDYIAATTAAISTGATTLDKELQRVREKVIAPAFPSWAEEIKNGANVADIAAPYIQSMSSVLEIPETAIDLHDPTLRAGIQGKNSEGKPAYKTLWEFEQDLRKDPRWQYTGNAKQEMTSLSSDVLNMMGF